MAFSRLEKIGNIYSRITGLMRSGALKWEDRPLFYDIYTAFPPIKEFKYMEPANRNLTIRDIFYEEDKERATRNYAQMPAFNMNENSSKLSDFERELKSKIVQKAPPEEKTKILDLKEIDFKE